MSTACPRSSHSPVCCLWPESCRLLEAGTLTSRPSYPLFRLEVVAARWVRSPSSPSTTPAPKSSSASTWSLESCAWCTFLSRNSTTSPAQPPIPSLRPPVCPTCPPSAWAQRKGGSSTQGHWEGAWAQLGQSAWGNSRNMGKCWGRCQPQSRKLLKPVGRF